MVRILLVTFFVVIFSSSSLGNDTKTGIFSSRFKSLKTMVADEFMSSPVLRLGTDDRIIVSFDEIGEDYSDLSYRLVHCNSDWSVSNLVESEYLDGFNTEDIDDYAYSTNTFVHYVNYRIEIPSAGMRPLLSGNYLLQVYDREEPDKVLLQTRFKVVEPIISIDGKVSSRTDKGVNDRWQQLMLSVTGDEIEKCNPYQDIKIEIEQNNRESTRRFLRAPLRVEGKRVVYEHQPELLFPASNEYRRFESVSTQFPGMNVDSTKYSGNNYHTWLKTDYPRAEHNYEYDRTQHGRFLVREYNATDSDIGADYIIVHFFLDTPEFIGQDIYIDGEFTYNRFNRFNRMEYNGETGGYELSMPVKQGAYNYQYVSIPKGENRADTTSLVEGDKYETENEYNISVYLRRPGERYDRLIGYQTIYSTN
ncbi:MAG: DUF5103 domain-containing protein [Muribaculaceae bacterium]|nr:DUF5103 domain-containing protein [Muribaculaceae bacterium]